MAPKKCRDPSKPKRKAVRTTIQVKKQLIANWESGTRVSMLAEQYGMAKSTISSILKCRESIKSADVAKGVKILAATRSPNLEEMEKLLLVWITENQLTGDGVSKAIICDKAKQIYSDLRRYNPDTSAEGEEFKASRGWFERFKKRSRFDCVLEYEVAASAYRDEAEKFMEDFKTCVHLHGFLPQQVFNCDETGLFWKRMPRRTCFTLAEKAMPGHQPMKDRLTLLLCANASGECKVKPLLVYHSENPRAFKANNVLKSNLSVMWRANSKACVTRQFFTEWIHEVFGPSVKQYLVDNNLPLRALLVLDTAPAHPPALEEHLVGEHSFIKVKFLPPNVTPLLQPMDQQIIASFKRLYTRALFKRCSEATSDTEVTLGDFWNTRFNILQCLRVIDKAWAAVSVGTLNAAWKRLWPDCVSVGDFEGIGEESLVQDIVSLGLSMGLEMNEEDVEELVEEHKHELTTEELRDLLKAQHEEVVEEISASEQERSNVSTDEIKALCHHWAKVQGLVEKWHPNVGVVNRSINLFNDSVIEHFRNILKSRQQHGDVNSVFCKEEESNGNDMPSSSSAPARRVKRERTPDFVLPDVFLKGHFLSNQ